MRNALLTAAALAAFSAATVAEAANLRLSNQWSTTDVHHQVALVLADEVAAADGGAEIKIFLSASLFKPREQCKPLSRNQLVMTVFPLSFAGGKQPSFNLTLMPGLVKKRDHSVLLPDSPFMDGLKAKMAEDDDLVLADGYQVGGFVSKDKCITKPADVAGLSIRAAGKSSDQMLAGGGASISSMVSSDIYSALQSGVLDAANTSSASLIAESRRGNTIWYSAECQNLKKSEENKINFTENGVKNAKAKILELKHEVRMTVLPDEQHSKSIPSHIQSVEKSMSQLRQRIFRVEDEINENSFQSISDSTARLVQIISKRELFSVCWTLG